MGVQELVTLALHLEPAARFDLIDQVLHSLDKPDSAIDQLWLIESERRLTDYRTGMVQGISAEDIFGEL